MLALLLLISEADNGFRCPDTSKLIHIGDHTATVRYKCREPDSRSQRTIKRKEGYWVGRVWQEVEVTVDVEEWFYDFGNQRFTRSLIFENDKLRRVYAGRYGTPVQ